MSKLIWYSIPLTNLKILKNAGFINSKKEGIWVYHKIKDTKITKILNELQDIVNS